MTPFSLDAYRSILRAARESGWSTVPYPAEGPPASPHGTAGTFATATPKQVFRYDQLAPVLSHEFVAA